MTQTLIVVIYLILLLVLGYFSSRLFRGNSNDYFVASRSIGPLVLFMSIFGTTMTAFAMVGSTGESYRVGIATYGKVASSSALIHSACFFLVGLPLWALGKRNGFHTQIEFFRARFESSKLGYLLFPILVGLIIPYLLVGLMGAGSVMQGVTRGAFPEIFTSTGGAVPPWLTMLVISCVVLYYIFAGGVRSAAWANTFQTCVFIVMGFIAFVTISSKLGGMQAASAMADPGSCPSRTAPAARDCSVSLRASRSRQGSISGRGQGSRLQASGGSQACSARSPGAAPPLTMLARRGIHSGRRAVLDRGQQAGRSSICLASRFWLMCDYYY